MSENKTEANINESKIENNNDSPSLISCILWVLIACSFFMLFNVFMQIGDKSSLLNNYYFQSYFETDNNANFQKNINEYFGEKTANNFYKKREEYFNQLDASISFENGKLLINDISSNKISEISRVVNKEEFNLSLFQLLGNKKIVRSENLLKFESSCLNNICNAEIMINNQN